jgi:hydroxymethylpyrimidine/phosphomethylpyrimidine kinase
VVLTIAGSDPTGGAGVQADLKTFERLGVTGAAVVTAVTVQTATDVIAVNPLAPATVAAQLEAVLATLTPRVVKCGLLASRANVLVVARALRRLRVPLVLDPVTAASGGAPLGERALLAQLVRRLFPLATVVTVNLGEAEAIVRRPVRDETDMLRAASAIVGLGPGAVVVKGGHLDGPPVDVVATPRRVWRARAPRLPHGMHGTGCAFASAVAAGLAHGRPLERVVSDARRHVRALIRNAVRTRDGGWLRS